ncbi:MAG: 3-dehydroquinate synthase [Tannerella sp.]|jgi:3-dehydroquinate synthase|nr:3-dehydroquinate synthase [Tannerella sp.]
MVVITKNIAEELENYLASQSYDKFFAVTDDRTHQQCLPLISKTLSSRKATVINIKSGEEHKNIEQVSHVWNALSNEGASRHSALISLGGGMVTDLAGFAGATFKRGLHNINIPTTLMASVDAATGGKTGVNFNGLKNEIGAFYAPDCVMIDCNFLKTLDRENILSGYSEMLKHGLISNKKYFNELLACDLSGFDVGIISNLVLASVSIKEEIVQKDPMEKGVRKALNLGHTVGHAIESLSFEKGRNPLLHGIAIAAGLICELYISYEILHLSINVLRLVTNFIKDNYPAVALDCKDYETLYELMKHDKKNEMGRINFTLLGNIGEIYINQEVSKEIIFESFDFYRENNL